MLRIALKCRSHPLSPTRSEGRRVRTHNLRNGSPIGTTIQLFPSPHIPERKKERGISEPSPAFLMPIAAACAVGPRGRYSNKKLDSQPMKGRYCQVYVRAFLKITPNFSFACVDICAAEAHISVCEQRNAALMVRVLGGEKRREGRCEVFDVWSGLFLVGLS